MNTATLCLPNKGEKPADQVEVRLGLEDWDYVVATKRSWRVWERPRERTVAQRYPRLLAALRRNCLLTELEAWCALSRQEPEAVRHLGGWQKAIQAAWESRHRY